MEIKDRIKMIMEREKMTSGAFAESIGIQQSTLSHILNGRNNPSLDVVMKVNQKYTYVNLEWILYGKGNIMNDSTYDETSSLYDQSLVNPGNESGDSENRKESALQTTNNSSKQSVIQEIRYIERPSRKITEIRIFFDDNTYETFKSEK